MGAPQREQGLSSIADPCPTVSACSACFCNGGGGIGLSWRRGYRDHVEWHVLRWRCGAACGSGAGYAASAFTQLPGAPAGSYVATFCALHPQASDGGCDTSKTVCTDIALRVAAGGWWCDGGGGPRPVRSGPRFHVRFRGNIRVENAEGEGRAANDWVPPNGRALMLRSPKVTDEPRRGPRGGRRPRQGVMDGALVPGDLARRDGACAASRCSAPRARRQAWTPTSKKPIRSNAAPTPCSGKAAFGTAPSPICAATGLSSVPETHPRELLQQPPHEGPHGAPLPASSLAVASEPPAERRLTSPLSLCYPPTGSRRCRPRCLYLGFAPDDESVPLVASVIPKPPCNNSASRARFPKRSPSP